MVEGQGCVGMVEQFLANGVQLFLDSVYHIGMDIVIQYNYTFMSAPRFLMVQRS